MSDQAQEPPGGFDLRFWHLVRWESRLMGLRGRRVLGVILILLALGTAFAVWQGADQHGPLGYYSASFHAAAVVLLLATPLQDGVANIDQMTFGYFLLRIAAYAVIAFARLVLPALAAGTVANDRQTRRMEELQSTPLTAESLYLAKVLAAALPSLTFGLLLLTLFAGVATAEFVPVGEWMRLMLETAGQVLLTALVAVTCSALFSSPWFARAMAYVVLWLLLPGLWLAILVFLKAVPSSPLADTLSHLSNAQPNSGDTSFTTICLIQVTLTGFVCLIAILVGVRKMHPYGARRLVRNPFRRRT